MSNSDDTASSLESGTCASTSKSCGTDSDSENEDGALQWKNMETAGIIKAKLGTGYLP